MKNIVLFTLLLLTSASSFSNTQRLISIDGALTEIVYAIGAEKNLVAVDSTSLHPSQTSQLANVGYLRALSTEGILSLQPTSIITTSSAGPESTILQLKESGVELTIIDQPYSIEGVINKVLAVGKALNQKDNANLLVSKINTALAPVFEKVESNKENKMVTLFFLGMQGNQLMAAGNNTQADAMLKLAGLTNAGKSFHSYKPLSKEAVLNINPDMIIIAQHTVLDEKAKEAFAYTKAYKNNKILLAKSEDLLGFGPRIAENLELIVNAAYK